MVQPEMSLEQEIAETLARRRAELAAGHVEDDMLPPADVDLAYEAAAAAARRQANAPALTGRILYLLRNARPGAGAAELLAVAEAAYVERYPEKTREQDLRRLVAETEAYRERNRGARVSLPPHPQPDPVMARLEPKDREAVRGFLRHQMRAHLDDGGRIEDPEISPKTLREAARTELGIDLPAGTFYSGYYVPMRELVQGESWTARAAADPVAAPSPEPAVPVAESAPRGPRRTRPAAAKTPPPAPALLSEVEPPAPTLPSVPAPEAEEGLFYSVLSGGQIGVGMNVLLDRASAAHVHLAAAVAVRVHVRAFHGAGLALRPEENDPALLRVLLDFIAEGEGAAQAASAVHAATARALAEVHGAGRRPLEAA